MSHTKLFPLPAALALTLLAAPALAAPPVYDEIYTYGAGKLTRASLPAGPAQAPIAAAAAVTSLQILPSGELLATTLTGDLPAQVMLNEMRPDGSLRPIGVVGPSLGLPTDLMDMAIDSRGRFFLALAERFSGSAALLRVDPATGAVLSIASSANIAYGIATAPKGLYGIAHGREISEVDPDTGELGDHIANIALYGFGAASQLDAGSDGRLYFLFTPSTQPPCEPSCTKVLTTLPQPGVDRVEEAPAALSSTTPDLKALAIDRRCYESDTARCLQRGRFRAEVSYAAYDGAAGNARTIPAESPDTAIFYFFGPENWELMVKALDGCGINSRYWVYSSASTDVEYTMTITDTETLAQKVYTNALGHIAETVTDNLAFPCDP